MAVDVEVSQLRDGLSKLTVRIYNLTPMDATQTTLRADALMQSLVSAHTILAVEGGEYVSLLDPSDDLKDLAAECKNVGTWPVMIGEEGARRRALFCYSQRSFDLARGHTQCAHPCAGRSSG